jgi:clan AA aspartic protease (TIGR02281 family)
MKKLTLSGCLVKLFLTVIVIMGFLYGFSRLFPRAYSTLEAKALGIKEDSVTAVVQKKDSIPKKDSIQWTQVKSPKEYIKLRHEDNCYIVPCIKLNGIPMEMLLDTGAANLSISIIEYEFLKKQHLLSDTTVGTVDVTIANGSTVQAYTTKIHEVSIGGEIINDVECIVMPQTDAPLLLGMNVLRKLGNFRIDYERNWLILKE